MTTRLAMVLAGDAVLPAASEIQRAHESIAGEGEELTKSGGGNGTELAFAGAGGTQFFVTAADGPVPDEEADQAAEYSIAALGTDWELPEHSAHYVVIAPDCEEVEGLVRFTHVVAAVAHASGAVGVYWGDAGATHPGEFFAEVAAGDEMPITLWSGVSVAGAEGDRISLLSLGMTSLGIPNLMVEAPEEQGEDALAFLFNLLAHLVDRGEGIAEGETVGRSEDERLEVKHVPSPIEDGETVMLIEME